MLFPNEKPLAGVFEAEFEGMTTAPVQLDALLATRQRMLEELPRSLLPYAHLEQLPAHQWKPANLYRLKRNTDKFKLQHDELAARLAQARG